MTFAIIVRACTALGCLTEHQIALALDALDGKEVELTDVDRAAQLQFVRKMRAELGEVRAAAGIERLTVERERGDQVGVPRPDRDQRAERIERALSLGRDTAQRLQRARIPEDADHVLFGHAPADELKVGDDRVVGAPADPSRAGDTPEDESPSA